MLKLPLFHPSPEYVLDILKRVDKYRVAGQPLPPELIEETEQMFRDAERKARFFFRFVFPITRTNRKLESALCRTLACAAGILGLGTIRDLLSDRSDTLLTEIADSYELERNHRQGQAYFH